MKERTADLDAFVVVGRLTDQNVSVPNEIDRKGWHHRMVALGCDRRYLQELVVLPHGFNDKVFVLVLWTRDLPQKALLCLRRCNQVEAIQVSSFRQ